MQYIEQSGAFESFSNRLLKDQLVDVTYKTVKLSLQLFSANSYREPVVGSRSYVEYLGGPVAQASLVLWFIRACKYFCGLSMNEQLYTQQANVYKLRL